MFLFYFILFIIFIYLIIKLLSGTRELYIDENGYYRYVYNQKLVHRDVAYKYIYKNNKHKYPLRFRNYQVHHKNRNKLDNDVENLQIVTREEHEKIHGITKINREWSRCSCLDKYGQQVNHCTDCGNHKYLPDIYR